MFRSWGLPAHIQVDNGHPWGLNKGLPPDLALWLIGLGIAMHWIPPGQPQKDGTAERGNGVMQQWSEPSSCRTRGELRARLEREGRVQRERYPAIGGLSRIEAYPGLKHSGRPYDRADEGVLWELARVDRFLATGRLLPPGQCGARSGCMVGVGAWAAPIAVRRSAFGSIPRRGSG